MDRRSALALLPDVYTTALWLRSVGLTEREVAERLHMPPESVGPLFEVAELKLAALLGPASGPPG